MAQLAKNIMVPKKFKIPRKRGKWPLYAAKLIPEIKTTIVQGLTCHWAYNRESERSIGYIVFRYGRFMWRHFWTKGFTEYCYHPTPPYNVYQLIIQSAILASF